VVEKPTDAPWVWDPPTHLDEELPEQSRADSAEEEEDPEETNRKVDPS